MIFNTPFPELTPEHIAYLKSLSPITAITRIITGEFAAGEDEYLIEAIRAGAKVSCDEDEMWEILYHAMDHASDPLDVLNQLS